MTRMIIMLMAFFGFAFIIVLSASFSADNKPHEVRPSLFPFPMVQN